MRILTLFVRHGTTKYGEALEDLRRFHRTRLPGVDHDILVIDNALQGPVTDPPASHELIAGSNRSWEFSAWDEGLVHVGSRVWGYDLVHLVTAAHGELYTRYIDRFDEPMLDLVAGRGAAVGHIDCYNEPVELLGCNTQSWLRTSFLFVPPAELATLGSLVGVHDGAAFFSGDPEHPFRTDAPLSERYCGYIIDWLTGPGTGQGTTWHSRFELSAETLAFFEAKALAILNEHLLAIRLRRQGCALVDATWLATQAGRTGAPKPLVIPHWRAQLAARDTDAVVLSPPPVGAVSAGGPTAREAPSKREQTPARTEEARGQGEGRAGGGAVSQLRARMRRLRYARLIRRSGLFDEDYYRAQCGNDPLALRDPIEHYLVLGAAEGRNPGPLFDTAWYLDLNPEVAAAFANGKNPLVHFIRSGASAGGTPRPPLGIARARAGAGGTAVAPWDPRSRHVLVVDRYVPTPDQDSGSVRMSAILRLLREIGNEVTFISQSEVREARYEDEMRRLGIDVLRGTAAALAHLAAAGARYRCVLLSRPEQAYRYLPTVRACAPDAKVIYDTVDLHWVRLDREAQLTGSRAARDDAARFRRMERANAVGSDLVLTVTPQEKELLRAEIPGVNAEVLPNVHPSRASSPPWSARQGLLFIGGFDHAPNLDAVHWFIERILPLIQADLPGVALDIVGSKPPDRLKGLASPGVRVAGHVPDAAPYFDGARVLVSPLRYGAGMKGKIGQSMSLGLPVVTTSIGAEGLLLVDGENALVADTPEAFSRAVVRLYSDPALWARLSVNGSCHVTAHFSEDAAKARLEAILSDLGCGSAPAVHPPPSPGISA